MTPTPPHSRSQTDWLPSLIVGGYGLFTSVMFFFMPIYFADELGFSGIQIGQLYSVLALAGFLAALPAGLGNDRLTSRSLIIGALVVQGGALFLLNRVSLFPVVLAIYFVWSITNNVFRLSAEMQMLKSDTGERTSQRMSLFLACRFGGLAIGTFFAGYVLYRLDFRGTFLLIGLFCLFLIVPAYRLAPTPIAKNRLSAYWGDLKSWPVILFIGWMFLFTTHWGVEYTCYGLFLKRELHLSLTQMGHYMCVEYLAVLATALLIGPRMGRPGALTAYGIAGLLLSGVGHIGMVNHHVAVSLAFRALHGVGDGIIMVLTYLGIARLFDVNRMGGNAGAINLAMTLGMITGALIAGPLGEKVRYSLPIWVSGILLLLLALPLVAKTRLGKRFG
ncbi:MAG: MFS transporter [Myxococcales bacterium]|nr:MFS transporter [Myxococcales bacterium]